MKQELALKKELRNNYVSMYVKLVALDVASYYKYFKNNHKEKLITLFNSSKEPFWFDDEETTKICNEVKQLLKQEHNLEVISDDYEKLIIRELENEVKCGK